MPKTIDNDILFTDKSFGYETACAAAAQATRVAHTEACTVRNGIGMVKLMGRHSGFIACSAALATNEADFVLIPEVSLSLEGENGLLEALHRRILQKGNALIVVAEGAGQELFNDSIKDTDPSGNILFKDIGLLLKRHIEKYFKERSLEVRFKYIDPSYMIRGVPANPHDSIYLRASGPKRCSCRDGRQNRSGHGMLAWTLCACSNRACCCRTQAGRSQRGSLAFADRSNRPVTQVFLAEANVTTCRQLDSPEVLRKKRWTDLLVFDFSRKLISN
jgi:6-phosphofructokinase